MWVINKFQSKTVRLQQIKNKVSQKLIGTRCPWSWVLMPPSYLAHNIQSIPGVLLGTCSILEEDSSHRLVGA